VSTMWMGEKISNKNLKEKIKERVAGKVDVQLGKSGVTEEFISEVKNRLKKQGVVKIRVLKSLRKTCDIDIEKLAREIAEKTESRIYEVRGFTFILIKEK